MARKKEEGASWPEAWANNAPASRGGSWEEEETPERYKEVVEDDTFHLGQSYEDEAAISLQCISCGGTQFNIGQGNYFTAIRCPVCGWEESIHDG